MPMDTDTYRYLMSALMQVFGALVALDAIFLVFQQQAMGSLKTKLLQQIGRHVSLINKFGELSFNTRREIVAETERYADVFETLKHAEILHAAETAFDAISSKITHEDTKAKQMRAKADADRTVATFSQHAYKHEQNLLAANRTRTVLAHCSQKYRNIHRQEEQMPKVVTATMAVPAGLVVLFAVALAPAGHLSEGYNAWTAAIAVLLSAGALFYLVWTARGIMVGIKDVANQKTETNPAPVPPLGAPAATPSP